MARFIRPTNQRFGALNQLTGGFTEGYDTMSRWRKEAGEEKDRNLARASRDQLAELFEQGPEATTTAIPDRMAAGMDHPGKETERVAGTEITTKDWTGWYQKMMRAKMRTGDVAGAMAAQEMAEGMMHKGAMQYAGQGLALLEAGDLEGAAQALNQANQYFPNGSRNVHQVVNGQLVMLGLDEETGKPRANPVAVTPEYLTNVVANMQDPEKFLAWTRHRQGMKWKKEEQDQLKKHREETLKFRREEMESDERRHRERLSSAERLAGAKAGKASAENMRRHVSAAEKFALDAIDKMPEGELKFLEQLGYGGTNLATLAGHAARDNPDASPAELFDIVMEEVKKQVLAGQEEPAAGPPGVGPGQAIPGAPSTGPLKAAREIYSRQTPEQKAGPVISPLSP